MAATRNERPWDQLAGGIRTAGSARAASRFPRSRSGDRRQASTIRRYALDCHRSCSVSLGPSPRERQNRLGTR